MGDPKQKSVSIFMLLGTVALGLLVLLLGQLISPVKEGTQSPRAVFTASYTPSYYSREPNGSFDYGDIGELKYFSANDLNIILNQLGYDLEGLVEAKRDVPRVFFRHLPYDMSMVEDIENRKSLFFRVMLPLVLKVNEEIAVQRAKVWKLRYFSMMGMDIGAQDKVWLQARFDQYKVQNGQYKALLAKMDVLPPSLILAQAAEESGWGTSRFVREGNALFGQWTYDSKAPGIIPQGRVEGKTHRIRAFRSLQGSLEAYVMNLNTHNAYRELRQKRASLRANAKEVNGLVLAASLEKYSERGEEYVQSLQNIINKNDLGRFDHMKLDEQLVTRLAGPTT